MSWKKEVEEIERRKRLAKEQGGEKATERQHAKGRLTLRERIDQLLDKGSFKETGPAAGGAETADDGSLKSFTPGNFLLGFGKIANRPCVVGGEDFTLQGGSPNVAGLRKSIYAEELAVKYKVPLIRLHEGGGGSVTGSKGKGASGPAGDPVFYPPRFQSVAKTLVSVPVASAALGPVAGMPAARLVASHFSVMVKGLSQILTAGPAVVERALGKRPTKESLGGSHIHSKNGVVDSLAETEAEALQQIQNFLSYLPQNVWETPPVKECTDDVERREEELLSIIPRDRRTTYDMYRVLEMVLDNGSFFEMAREYGRGLITGLARINGQSVGIIANDCRFYAGAMTATGSQKVRRFISLCDTFHIPIVNFVDEPGFMIGEEAEQDATIRYGTAAVLAACSCTVPWASVIVRRVFGVAGAAHFGPDAYILSWPSAETGALPVEGGVAVAYGKEIANSKNPEKKRREIEQALASKQSPFPRAECFSVHDLIDPRETRPLLCDWISLVQPLLPELVGSKPGSFHP